MQLTLNGKTFQWSDIQQQSFLDDFVTKRNLSQYEKNTLAFCHEWLTGKESFQLQTSGSTGTPKPILITRKQMQASAQATAKALQLQRDDKSLVCLNTGYIAGKMMLVRGFELGMEMTVIEPVSNPLNDFSTDDHFDFMAVVPLQLKTMLDESSDQLPVLQKMKAIIVGGAPVDLALQQKLQIVEAPVYATYGMTETVSHIALKKLNGPDAADTYTVLEGVDVGTDNRGCLTIQGAVSNDLKLVTNDLVHFTSNRHFQWMGRIDNVINSGGVKIASERVEQEVAHCFYKLGYPNQFFIAGLPDERLGQKVVLITEGEALKPAVEDYVKEQIAAHVHAYAVPRDFYCLPEFELTPTGKIARKVIVANFV